MTILVGILCQDGVVIAADGMASQNLGTTPFVGISNLKVHPINDDLIVACAGDDNLMTHFICFLKSNYLTIFKEHQAKSSNVLALMTELGGKFAHHIMNIYRQYPAEWYSQVLETFNRNGFSFQAVIALHFNHNHYMFSYDNRFNAMMLRDNGIWHIILGSGHLVANPSIHLVKKILNIKLMPKVDRGQILAYWTVSHAIDVSSGGIGGEIKIAVLQKSGEKYVVSTANNISEHEEFIEDMYKHIWRYNVIASKEEQIQQIPNFKT